MREKSSFSSLTYEVSEDEILVAKILVELPSLIKAYAYAYAYKSPFRFSLGWGSTRKRSANDGNRHHQSPSRPPSLPSSSFRGSCAVVSTPEPEPDRAPPKLKVEASSPATPLSFSPSESDDKPKPSKRRLQIKRKKEEWSGMIEELTQRQELLKGEIENVNRYKMELEAFNLKLKARKQELTLGPKRETLCLEIGRSLNLQMELGLASVKSLPTDQSPSILDQAAQITEISDIHYPVNQIPFSSVDSINENMVGARGVPDLNLTADEFTVMVDLGTANKNLSKVMAAQARRNRIKIYRVKNSIAANKLRYR